MSDKTLFALTMIMTAVAGGGIAYGVRQAEHVDTARSVIAEQRKAADKLAVEWADAKAKWEADAEGAQIRIDMLKMQMRFDDLTKCRSDMKGRELEVTVLRGMATDKDNQLKRCRSGG